MRRKSKGGRYLAGGGGGGGGGGVSCRGGRKVRGNNRALREAENQEGTMSWKQT